MMLFVYGTIRKGHVNHKRFRFNERTRFVDNGMLFGYKMYNLGSYPCVVKTEDEEDRVIGELYEGLDEDIFQEIADFEELYGYEEEYVEIDGVKASTFILNEVPEDADPIESGDWNDCSIGVRASARFFKI